jgi:hypothetical protein
MDNPSKRLVGHGGWEDGSVRTIDTPPIQNGRSEEKLLVEPVKRTLLSGFLHPLRETGTHGQSKADLGRRDL